MGKLVDDSLREENDVDSSIEFWLFELSFSTVGGDESMIGALFGAVDEADEASLTFLFKLCDWVINNDESLLMVESALSDSSVLYMDGMVLMNRCLTHSHK